MSNKEYIYEIELSVRDYECDLQGIVNNANYQHYLEHARHEYLLSKEIDFAKLHKEGTDLVVSRIEIDYKTPLKSRDKFVVKLNVRKEGRLRIIFDQDIYRLSDNKIVVQGKVTGVCLHNGRPKDPEELIPQLVISC